MPPSKCSNGFFGATETRERREREPQKDNNRRNRKGSIGEKASTEYISRKSMVSYLDSNFICCSRGTCAVVLALVLVQQHGCEVHSLPHVGHLAAAVHRLLLALAPALERSPLRLPDSTRHSCALVREGVRALYITRVLDVVGFVYQREREIEDRVFRRPCPHDQHDRAATLVIVLWCKLERRLVRRTCTYTYSSSRLRYMGISAFRAKTTLSRKK